MSRPARTLLWALLAFGLTALLMLAAGVSLLATSRGSLLLLTQLPGVQAEGMRGPLLGDFEADHLQLKLSTGEQIELRGLAWRSLRWESGGLKLDRLSVQQLLFRPSPTPSTSAPLQAWRSPVAVEVAAIEIAALDLAGVQLQDLRAAGSLGDRHAFTLQRLRWQQLQLAGELAVDGSAPMSTRLALRVSSPENRPADAGTDLPAWRGELLAQGPLAALQTTGRLDAEGQSLALQGLVRPFAPWPLGAFTLETHALDLAALHSAAPRTALEGEARLTPEANTTRQHLHLRLANPHVGRWDLGHLPVRELVLDASFMPDELKALRIDALQARLGGDARITGRGQVSPDGRWQLQAQLDDLQPERLDARLVAGRLDGPVDLSGGGGQPLKLRFDLQGQRTPTPLRLRALLTHEGERWRLDEGEILAAGGRATLSGQLDPAGSSTFTGRLADFDPSRLWRGSLPAMRLNGQFDGQHSAQGSAARTALQLSLQDSKLAELPLSGQAKLERGATATPWGLQLQLKLGSADLTAQAQGRPESFEGRLRLQAPQLSELNTLKALHPALAHIAGKLKLDTSFALSHPNQAWRLVADGQGESSQLRWGEQGRLNQLQARWQLPALDSPGPLALDLKASGISLPGLQLNELQAQLDGNWAAHRLQLKAGGPSPLAGRQADTLALQADAQGGLEGLPDLQRLQWRGRLARVQLAPPRPGLPPLLEAQDLALQASAQGLDFAPAQADIAGARIAWQTLRWQPKDTGDEALLDLRLLPFDVSPLLARWQPDFGWTGDLRVGGSARWQWRAGRLDGDLLIERLGGDLRVQDDAGPLPLGLSDLRLAASHHDGVWRFAQGVAGQQLGNFVATQSLSSPGPWPDAHSALDGVLQAQVDHLSRWGSWLPAGWRLGGRINGLARLSGRLGAPLWTGQVEGDGLSVRHALQGVDVGDGRILLKLDGDKARLEQFEAHAGQGLITATGDAELGAKPAARLQFQADRLQILGRADQRLVASGKAQLSLTPESLQLKGQLRADQGRFDFSRADAPTLADDVVVQRGPVVTAERATRRAPTRTTQVDLDVDLGDAFRVLGRGLETQLRGKLHLGQRDNKLALTGKIQTHGGQYLAYGQRLDIEQGELLFTGPYDNPALDVIATRPNTDTRVGVRITGTALAPRVALFSEPELSETEKLSWLLLGRGPDGLGRTDAALLQRAAVALLAGEGGSGRSLRSLGLDELSVARADDDTRTTIVRLGRQLSQRWYVGYERSLNATTGSWQLIYRIAQRFTLRAQSGDDNALDLIWQWRWN